MSWLSLTGTLGGSMAKTGGRTALLGAASHIKTQMFSLAERAAAQQRRNISPPQRGRQNHGDIRAGISA
jgi:hypothetical protein